MYSSTPLRRFLGIKYHAKSRGHQAFLGKRSDGRQTDAWGKRLLWASPRTSGVVTKPFNCRYLTGLKLQSRWRCCNVLFKQFFSVWFYYSSVFSSVLVHWSFCGRWVSSELYLFLVYYHDHCHFTFFNYGVAHWEYGLFMLPLTGIYFITILLCKVLTNDLIV